MEPFLIVSEGVYFLQEAELEQRRRRDRLWLLGKFHANQGTMLHVSDHIRFVTHGSNLLTRLRPSARTHR